MSTPPPSPASDAPTSETLDARASEGAEGSGPSRRRRGFETVRDMVLSMALVGAVVVAVFLVVAWQRPEVQGPIRPDVDVPQLFADVEVAKPFPVLEPTGLPEGWTATSAWFEPETASSPVGGGVLHVGYVTPADSYAEVRQTDGSPRDAVAEWVGDDAEQIGSREIAGQEWSLVESDESQKQALVLTDDASTVVVTGKAGTDELEILAASLQ